MRLVSDEAIQKLLEGIERGMSRRKLAKYAGISPMTAGVYRKLYEENLEDFPTLCGCGRPLKHQGRCHFRRSSYEEPKG